MEQAILQSAQESPPLLHTLEEALEQAKHVDDAYERWTNGSYQGKEETFFRDLHEAETDFLEQVSDLTGERIILKRFSELRDELIDHSDLLNATHCTDYADIAERRNAFAATVETLDRLLADMRHMCAELAEETRLEEDSRRRASLLSIRPVVSGTLYTIRHLIQSAEVEIQQSGETFSALDANRKKWDGASRGPEREGVEEAIRAHSECLNAQQKHLQEVIANVREAAGAMLSGVQSILGSSSPEITALFKDLVAAPSVHHLAACTQRIQKAFATMPARQISPYNRGATSPVAAWKESKESISVEIRWMIRRDMPEVLDIESECFEFPWLDGDFIRCLRQRNNIGVVAEHEGHIVGFMIYELRKKRIHVLNFAVHPDFRRENVGSRMVQRLVAKLSSQRHDCILLEVRESNLPAHIFFRENGFKQISVLRNFYEDSPEDAYLMQRKYEQNDKRTTDEEAAAEWKKYNTKEISPPAAAPRKPNWEDEPTFEELLGEPNDDKNDKPKKISALPTEWNPDDDEKPWTPDQLKNRDPYGLWSDEDDEEEK